MCRDVKSLLKLTVVTLMNSAPGGSATISVNILNVISRSFRYLRDSRPRMLKIVMRLRFLRIFLFTGSFPTEKWCRIGFPKATSRYCTSHFLPRRCFLRKKTTSRTSPRTSSSSSSPPSFADSFEFVRFLCSAHFLPLACGSAS